MTAHQSWSPEEVKRVFAYRAKPISIAPAVRSRGLAERELVRLGRVVRDRVALWTRDNPKVDNEDLLGACGIAAHAMNQVLRALGWHPVLKMWSWLGSHCWTEVGRWAVDLTATQFNSRGRSFPEVYVVPRRSYDVVGDDVAGTETRSGYQAEIALEGWEDQSPVKYGDQIRELALELSRERRRQQKGKRAVSTRTRA